MAAGDAPVGEDASAHPGGRGHGGPQAGPGAGAGPGAPGAEPAGRAPAVRPFLVTAGRVAGERSGAPIPVETQVVATVAGIEDLDRLTFEEHDIVAICRQPQSVAEIAAKLRLHLNVVRVLAEDLRAGGRLSVYVPQADIGQDLSILRRVIDGLRTIPDSRGDTP